MKKLFYLAVISIAMLACNNSQRNSSVTNNGPITVHDRDIHIAYTDTGKSDTTLLFVHGWAINKGYWANQAAYFGKRYRVVAIDLPGFGESGKNRDKWGTTEYSSDVDSVIKELNLKKVILVGHSMSGDIVLQSAIDNPDRVIGIVGVDNFKNVGAPQTEADKKGFADAIAAMKKNFKQVANGYVSQMLFSKTTSSEIKKRVLSDVDHADTIVAVAAMEQGNDFDELAKLQQSKKKLYLINSDVNPTNTKYLTAKNIPFQVFYTHGTGHFAMIEVPDEFNGYLDKIIEDIKK
ncbi:MAG TPA: alpha/beta hydrolase [Mucilaginibacter sp.]|jgi:pimeloyl-ACP methyl ester carboxylesterase|nr:alpha/beta hydrolase [Mucilaginibacter sp.]